MPWYVICTMDVPCVAAQGRTMVHRNIPWHKIIVPWRYKDVPWYGYNVPWYTIMYHGTYNLYHGIFKTYFVDVQTSKELIQIDINKKM